jgi:hypothetical protein
MHHSHDELSPLFLGLVVVGPRRRHLPAVTGPVAGQAYFVLDPSSDFRLVRLSGVVQKLPRMRARLIPSIK